MVVVEKLLGLLAWFCFGVGIGCLATEICAATLADRDGGMIRSGWVCCDRDEAGFPPASPGTCELEAEDMMRYATLTLSPFHGTGRGAQVLAVSVNGWKEVVRTLGLPRKKVNACRRTTQGMRDGKTQRNRGMEVRSWTVGFW